MRASLRPLLLGLVTCLMALAVGSLQATNHEIRINEVMAGLNGDSSIQFVEMVIQDRILALAFQGKWGPQSGEAVGRARLVFFDAAGRQTGRFVFPSNVPNERNGDMTVLVATREFANLTRLTPDFIMPKGIMPVAGKVRFEGNPDAGGAAFRVTNALSYGGASFTGLTEGAGAANPAQLPIMAAQSLRRFQNFGPGSFGPGTQFNSDFALGTPTPSSSLNANPSALTNGTGEVSLPSAASSAVQGRTLFEKETFLGNGRTCATCHRSQDDFGLTAVRVASLPANDPLFIHELNVNRIVVNAGGSVLSSSVNGTQPSDFFLSGSITGSLSGASSAVVLAGSGTNYFILGGTNLNMPGNVLSDTNGNKGTLVSFTLGTLDGMNLENSTLMRGGRALILENINGFTQAPFMRGSPPLVNALHTAPYGLSGEFMNLRDFSTGAVRQHFPRSINRVAGVDFRDPTTAELQALEAFQQSLLGPTNGVFDDANRFARFATTEAQKRGRDLFFGAARCAVCHDGKALATSSGEFGTSLGANESFNTGVANLLINTQDGLPTEQDIGQPANSRRFSTPGLFGVRKTAPYFHDHSKPDLTEAILFYDSTQFKQSPAALQIGAGNLFDGFTVGNVGNIRAFLESLVDTPVDFTRQVTLLTRCTNAGANVLTMIVTNTGTVPLTLSNVRVAGTNAALFTPGPIVPNAGPFGTGQTRSMSAALFATMSGIFTATLEFDVTDGTNSFSGGAALVASADFIVNVDHTFAGPNPDGTLAAPFPTVTQGNQAACDGNILRIRGGSYPAGVSVTKSLRIEGTNGIVNIGM